MQNITVRDIPDRIYQAIKQNAIANKRSINAEILYGLEQNYQSMLQSKRHTIEELRRLRAKTEGKIYLTETEITEAKNEGRL